MKDAVRSLLKDIDRAVFYWIVFVLSSMFMFIFFRLAMSEMIGVTFIYSDNNLPTYLTVFDVFICMLVIFLANNFYVEKKSRELAMILVCGGTYIQLAEFLLFQTGILMAAAILPGILLGHISIPLLHTFLTRAMGFPVVISSTREAVVATICVIVFEVFWCTMLNLGYSYRNSICSLLHGESKIRLKTPKILKTSGSKWFYVILYVGCAGLMYVCGEGTEKMMFLGAAGLLGLNGSVNYILFPFLEREVSGRWIDDPEKLVSMGLFREDLKMVRLYITLFISTAVILSAAIASAARSPVEMLLALLSFVMIIPLLALSLMFRFATETVGRKEQFRSLLKIGYLESQLKSIMKKELLCLYGFILAASMFYILNIVLALGIHKLISFPIAVIIIVIVVVSLAVCGVGSYVYYSNGCDC